MVGDFSAACGVDEDVRVAGAGVGLVVGGCAARVRFDAALLGFAAALVGAAVVVAGVVGGGVMAGVFGGKTPTCLVFVAFENYHPKAKDYDGNVFPGGGFFCVGEKNTTQSR